MNTKDFWKHIFKYSRNKYREKHLDKYHVDIKCPNCNEWFSISGIDCKHKNVAEHDWGDSSECGKCGHISHWNLCAFPFPVLADENGTPIKENK